ncbi:hypothetical protein J3R30DRAFT_953840 [Lentinula aciculospora]|uniref:Uncharacterized protein n=1 Tax=Lentinula aciculospora TaxID=153920 RepID=A0A9W9DWE1_9AGAR|nr:hypothetical protein J3R30DRAFT_953840 [Lentinula aciculospora]
MIRRKESPTEWDTFKLTFAFYAGNGTSNEKVDIYLLSKRSKYRLNPISPIAIPHEINSDADDKAGSLKNLWSLANSWAILRDARLCPFPYEFLPKRYLEHAEDVFLSDAGNGAQLNSDPRKFVFVYGSYL